MIPTNKKIFTLGLILSGFMLVGCASKAPIPRAQKEILQTQEIKQTTNTKSEETSTTDTKNTLYTLQDIATHNTKTNCWTSIEDKVYDLTTAFGKHKGGDEALNILCGTDGTTKFNAQHGKNPKARGRLNTLQIGVLKK